LRTGGGRSPTRGGGQPDVARGLVMSCPSFCIGQHVVAKGSGLYVGFVYRPSNGTGTVVVNCGSFGLLTLEEEGLAEDTSYLPEVADNPTWQGSP
jgi:hypothetical protein